MSTNYLTRPDGVWSRSPMQDEGTPYVSSYAASLAKKWQARFTVLPPESGLLFIAIKAVPAERGLVRAFDVILGYGDQANAATALARQVLADVLAEGEFTLHFTAYHGVACAAADARAHRHS